MANPTADEIVKLAQKYVKDESGTKYDADVYMTHLNTAMRLLYDKHPSAFYVSSIVTAPPSTVELSGEVAVLPRYADALAHYIAAQLLMEGADDEYNRKLGKDHLDLYVSLSA